MTENGSVPSLADVEAWSTDHLTTAAADWTRAACLWEDRFTELTAQSARPGGTVWTGQAADGLQRRVYSDRLAVLELVDQLHDTASAARIGADQIQTAKRVLLAAVDTAVRADFKVGQDFSVRIRERGAVAVNFARSVRARALEAQIRDCLGDLIAEDQQVASAISTAAQAIARADFIGPDGGDSGGAAPADRTPGSPAEADRRDREINAFREVFGRDPVSPGDWDTAAALDPHSYDAKNGGVPPSIVVGRINAVPGQGAVRANFFIPSEDVLLPKIGWPLFDKNLGDDRRFAPTAGPESSRVSIRVDFDNGIIVARQNPSVNSSTGAVRTGSPSVAATQRSDGSVLITYNAADPFSPGGEDLAKRIPIDVNGTLAVALSSDGPRVGAEVTTYPAMEIYHDVPGGGIVPLVQSWPSFADDASGPLLGLPFHKTVGDDHVLGGFNDVVPEAPPNARIAALTPPSVTPEMSAVPPPLTTLGLAATPPRIPVRDPIIVSPGH